MLPVLYQNHNLILYSYPLLMGLGWGIAYQVFFSKSDIPKKFGQLLFWGIFVSAWVGSKLFFYLTSVKDGRAELLAEASFWTGGGFVFYGGLLLALLFIGVYRFFKFPLTLNTVWSMLLALTLGHGIGRIGCLLAGCCYGEVTAWWWGIEMQGHHRHPTQILEALGLFALSFTLLKMKITVRSISLYFTGYGVLRFLVELLRGDTIRGQWGIFSPSQWISLGLILLGTTLLFSRKFKRLEVLEVK